MNAGSYLIGLVLGLLLGVLCAGRVWPVIGTMEMRESPEDMEAFIKLDEGLYEFRNRKCVRFKVHKVYVENRIRKERNNGTDNRG